MRACGLSFFDLHGSAKSAHLEFPAFDHPAAKFSFEPNDGTLSRYKKVEMMNVEWKFAGVGLLGRLRESCHSTQLPRTTVRSKRPCMRCICRSGIVRDMVFADF